MIKHNKGWFIILTLVSAIWLTGCSTTAKQTDMSDPFENFNRKVYVFNENVDQYALKPVATQYDKLPKPIKTGVKNFFNNLGEPANMVNNLLQGKVRASVESGTRFIFNSTFGLLGIIDWMTPAGLPERDEDIDQTLAVWGVAPGPYLMLPFLGPRTLRDASRIPLGFATSPLTYAIDENFWVDGAITALDIVDIRSGFLGYEETLALQLDPYAEVRRAYYRSRRSAMYDGNPPEAANDDPFDEGYEDDFNESATESKN